MFIAILSEAHANVAERAEEEPDEFIVKMREGWRKRVRALSKRRYQGSETVEELARSLKEAQDTVIDTPQATVTSVTSVSSVTSVTSITSITSITSDMVIDTPHAGNAATARHTGVP